MTGLANYLEQKQKGIAPNRTGILGGAPTGGASNFKTAGEIFTQSDAYKGFLKNGQTQSDVVEIPNLTKQRQFNFATKALLDSTGADGTLLRNYPIISAGQVPLNLRDVLNVQTTDQNSILYLRETGFTNNAGIAPEGTLKAESGIDYDTVSSNVQVIAHWLPTTRQIMADIPQMANTVNSRLLYGLQVVEESQILYGDGTGSNLLGLMVDTGVQVRNAPVGETRIDTIRRGINATYLSGFPATAIVLHPTDFMEMELLKSTQGEYILENIQDGNRLMLFGCPIVLSTSMVVGSYLIGAFGTCRKSLGKRRRKY
jgi:HK97 family phage major capsid protein